MKTGIIYSSIDGQTKKISKVLEEVLVSNRHKVKVCSIENFGAEINEFEKIVIGSSIRYGKHNDKIVSFINENADELARKKSAFFSVNLVARKPEKAGPETNPYVRKFLDSISWKPEKAEVFAGKLDYKRYKFTDRLMIKLIMLISRGPLSTKEPIEFTDWARVKAFAKEISEM